ncbi:DNA polymerase II large subunit [Candidatus Pacearchaeota archaeon]|nr:DNA polymerase II large subunit [Candidatus Pacearchaeota archaeon]
MNTVKYFNEIVSQVRKEYAVAEEARKQGKDPVNKVEIPLAMSLAEKCVGLISTVYPQMGDEVGQKISQRILDLEKEYGQLDAGVPLKIAEEVAKEKFCKFESLLQAIDAGIRVGFAYMTLGVVSSPIEGFTGITLKKTSDGKEFFAINYSGPVRSAGGTGAAFSLVIADYLRELFGYAKYDPTEQEVRRFVTEITDYHERINNLQYFPTEDELVFLAKTIPVQITGDPSEDKEVSNYKDLPRIDTNFIRGGMCLVFAEGLAQKAAKISRMIKSAKEKKFILSDWGFLEGYIELHKKREKGTKDVVATYIKDLVAGRPVFGHPSRSGSFRFRYGRSRVAGFSATSIHPATMIISNNFLSNGNQLKIERPTKGCVVTSCDRVDGPTIKLKNGSVKRMRTEEEAKKYFKEVEEIIYIGDLLFPLGDVMNRNAELPKPGYVEEWWKLDLEKKLNTTGENIFVDEYNLSFLQALELSEKYSIPLHPNFIFYWTQIKKEDFFWLLDWLQYAAWTGSLVLPFSNQDKEKFKEGKRALEILGVEHDVVLDNVVIKEGEAFLFNLGLRINSDFKEETKKIILEKKDKEGILEIVNSLSKFIIKDKAGDFIGARMGRPEKAKLRKLTGSPNVLFSVGEEGGRFRSLNEAVEKGFVKSEFPIFHCDQCKKETIMKICETCGTETKKRFYCVKCDQFKEHQECTLHGPCQNYSKRRVEVKDVFDVAVKELKYNPEDVPLLIKGVRGTTCIDHDFENISKGILRAKYHLCVNKDGTIRYDATEIPITHFKPEEVGASIEKLKELGYDLDIHGKEITKSDQIILMMPHDILLPCCPETNDEKADDVFFNIANFLDEELEKIYHLPRYYNLKTKEDLIGHHIVCMAPHNCAGVVGRILGFCKLQGLVASPFMHAAMRRDCDGDEAAVMMLLDVLLNFSRKFLPSHRGGTQDAPLVLNAHIAAGEVDDQILDFETCSVYPLSMYETAEQKKHSSEVKIITVKTLLKEGKDPFVNIGFTHDTANFNAGIFNSSYKILPTMKEKVACQMDLANKLRAVDAADVARLVIERHFIRDIRGNLRKFSHQEFRCVGCNEKFRRPPLAGVCHKCSGKIIFTISEGSIKKYLEHAIELATTYNIPEYTKQSLNLAKLYIESIFGRDADKQIDLKKFF